MHVELEHGTIKVEVTTLDLRAFEKQHPAIYPDGSYAFWFNMRGDCVRMIRKGSKNPKATVEQLQATARLFAKESLALFWD